ncbi:MAG: HupE/UreJ family protein [Deltaproteobacteria bacterium]|nr:HupE/UreJ family protein [Deltaproteobacteria bacterium]MBP7290893.1 HupE/UreJ family protein [Nannocystaceae bacterium]
MTAVRGTTIASALAVVLLGTTARDLAAHGPPPVGVRVEAHTDGAVEITIDHELALTAVPRVDISVSCARRGPPRRHMHGTRVRTTQGWSCDASLADGDVYIDGLVDGGPDAMVAVSLDGDTLVRDVATVAAPRVHVPPRASALATFASFVARGLAHLWRGADHLAFALALMLLARSRRATIAALTAFTLGHSLTLVAATLGWLRIPVAWAELGIAASLVAVAFELAVARARPRAGRLALAAALAGLLHGLGFATALLDAEGGVASLDGRLAPALVGFNVGIELGQVSLVLLAVLAQVALVRAGIRVPVHGRAWFGHGLGMIACMWCIARALALA